MLNFNLRGISPEMMDVLKQQAKQQDKSVNSFILKLLEQGVGYSPSKNPIHHELDFLAGTWDAKDVQEFENNSTFFESIDKEIWE
ncbi:MAG: hypothetical protein WC748_07645 [Legionellales bacterium]|jgi:hypothetical protein